MQEVELVPELAKVICKLFLNDKKITSKEKIMFELKKIIEKEYGLDRLEFLKIRGLVEIICILKNVDFSENFSNLSELFNAKHTEFSTVNIKKMILEIDTEKVHEDCLIKINEICKNLSADGEKFDFRWEFDNKYYYYYIQKNEIDKYVFYYSNLYESQIYIRRFVIFNKKIQANMPVYVKTGRIYNISKNKFGKIKMPYLDGFFLNEIQQLIKYLENYEITSKLVDSK